MTSEEYEVVNSATQRLGVIVSMGEFDVYGRTTAAWPVAQLINEGYLASGMRIAHSGLLKPIQPSNTHRFIAAALRTIADHCEKAADKVEEMGQE